MITDNEIYAISGKDLKQFIQLVSDLKDVAIDYTNMVDDLDVKETELSFDNFLAVAIPKVEDMADALGMDVPNMLTDAHPTEEILPFEPEAASPKSDSDDTENLHWWSRKKSLLGLFVVQIWFENSDFPNGGGPRLMVKKFLIIKTQLSKEFLIMKRVGPKISMYIRTKKAI